MSEMTIYLRGFREDQLKIIESLKQIITNKNF